VTLVAANAPAHFLEAHPRPCSFARSSAP
jgi:hypothetical protein